MDVSEQQLAQQAVAGDRDALSALLDRVGPMVERQLGPKIGAKWRSILSAEDVMQVTYFEAFLHIHTFEPRGEGSFAAWLTRMADNNLRDGIRDLERLKRPNPARRVQARSPDESAEDLLGQLGYTTTTPSRHAARGEIGSRIDLVLARLPADYAAVIRAYDLEGRTAAEVAQQLGRSEGAIFMLRARAHERLRGLLGSESDFFSASA